MKGKSNVISSKQGQLVYMKLFMVDLRASPSPHCWHSYQQALQIHHIRP